MPAETITAEADDRLDHLVAAFHRRGSERVMERADKRGVKIASIDDVEAEFLAATGNGVKMNNPTLSDANTTVELSEPYDQIRTVCFNRLGSLE